MLTVAGLAPSLDLTYVVDDLQLGRIHRPSGFISCPGGKPLNCARAALRLGADVEVVTLLGGPTGEVLRTGLEAEGMRVRVVATPVESRTCVSIASRGALTEVYPYADPVPPDVWSDFRTALAEAVRQRPGWLVISGGAPRDLPADALADLVRLGHDAGVQVAVDTHSAGLPLAVAQRPELVKINRSEAAELIGADESHDLRAMIDAIRERTGGIVVVTDGARGASAGDGTATFTIGLPIVRGHYPVGSGDSFLGGLLADLDAGRPLSDALVTAAAAGTANALVPGPGRFDIQTVKNLRSQITIRPHSPDGPSSKP